MVIGIKPFSHFHGGNGIIAAAIKIGLADQPSSPLKL